MIPNTTERTCGNCAAFDHDSDNTPYCINMVSFYATDGTHEPIEAGFLCDIHQTAEEDAAETAYIEANRPAIWASIHASEAIRKAKEAAK